MAFLGESGIRYGAVSGDGAGTGAAGLEDGTTGRRSRSNIEAKLLGVGVDLLYSVQRRVLAGGLPVFIVAGDFALMMRPTVHTPESGGVPIVEVFLARVISSEMGIHPDEAVENFKGLLLQQSEDR